MGPLYRAALWLMVASAISFGQHVLILNDGSTIRGRYDGGDADSVRFIDEHAGRHRFNIHEIKRLVFSSSEAEGTADRSLPQPSFAARPYVDTDEEPGAGWTRTAVIPAGTELVVRTIDPIEVAHPDPHQQYLATIEREVLDANGNVVIPRGSEAHLIVHKVGHDEIAVDLRSVNVNGRRLILNSENIVGSREGVGANRRTGVFAGAGALIGTVFGAIAGGGKGAAIGALAGGGAGLGTEVVTRGKALTIPSETILRFNLERPIYLYT